MNHGQGRFERARLLDVMPSVGKDGGAASGPLMVDDGSVPTLSWGRWLLVAVTVLCSLVPLACIGNQDQREPGAFGSLPMPLSVLVLGDTSAGSQGCASCSTYVNQLADAWSQGGRRRVVVDDRTSAADAASPSMPMQVESLHFDPVIRAAVSTADVVVLAVGSGDVTPRAGGARCPAKRRARCPMAPVEQFRGSLTAWMTETDTIRPYRPVVLRMITPPPTSGLPRQVDVARNACQIAVSRGATCVNVYDLARTDEHLVAAGADPRHPQLSQHGHDLVATQLIAMGLT